MSYSQQGDTKPPLNSASLQPIQDLWPHTRSSGSTQTPRGRAEKPFHGVALLSCSVLQRISCLV